MTPRLSHRHYRVQTRTGRGPWITRAHSVIFLGAVAAAEGYAEEGGVEARVVLGAVEYYRTGRTEAAAHDAQPAAPRRPSQGERRRGEGVGLESDDGAPRGVQGLA
jgi:hypothetical protein